MQSGVVIYYRCFFRIISLFYLCEKFLHLIKKGLLSQDKKDLCYKRLIHYYDVALLSSDARFSYLSGISIKKSRFDYARGMRLLAVVCQKTGSPFKIARETARVWASRDGREARREILRDRSSPRARRHYFCWPLHLNAILSAWAKYVIYGSCVSRTTEGFTALGTRGHPSGGPPKGIISLSLFLLFFSPWA